MRSKQGQLGRDTPEWWLAMGVRKLLIEALGMLEDYMGMGRSIIPQSKRRRALPSGTNVVK